MLPLDNRVLHTLAHPKPDWRRPRLRATYYPHTSPVPEAVAAAVQNRGHAIEVDVTIPEGEAAQGVLLAQGSVLGGYSLHLKDGRLRYVHNLYGKRRDVLEDADRAATRSPHRGVPVRARRVSGRTRHSCSWTVRWWPKRSSGPSPCRASTAPTRA